MKRLRRVLKITGITWAVVVGLVGLYVVASEGLSRWQVNTDEVQGDSLEIYITTNGVHTDLILPAELFLDVFPPTDAAQPVKNPTWVGIGYGEKNFYTRVPTWNDLTFSIAVSAIFWPTPTALHVYYLRGTPKTSEETVKVKVSAMQLHALPTEIKQYVLTDTVGKPIIIPVSYSEKDVFYEAKGSYHLFNTCNTWTNTCLRRSGMRSGVWAAFDWQVMRVVK